MGSGGRAQFEIDEDGMRGAMHADGNFLVTDAGERIGPFSSHWAACAAMIRRSNPNFKSLGGDKESDLMIERARPLEGLYARVR